MSVQKTYGAGTLMRISMIAATLLCSLPAWGEVLSQSL
jgi:hypothetical protein